MHKYIIPVLMMVMTGCTYSITMVHTSGTADDVVDDTKTTETEISPTLSIPAIGK